MKLLNGINIKNRKVKDLYLFFLFNKKQVSISHLFIGSLQHMSVFIKES